MSIKNHLFPFGLDKDKKLEQIDQYLNIELNTESKQYSTVLMGRQLEGLPITLKHNMKGYVWKQVKKINEDNMDYDDDYIDVNIKDADIEWIRTNKTVDDFILWKKDIIPLQNDPRFNALESWLDMSDLIHQPIPLNQEPLDNV
ncbi:unnamed protein product [Cunninghamella blakesleeana]